MIELIYVLKTFSDQRILLFPFDEAEIIAENTNHPPIMGGNTHIAAWKRTDP